MKMYLERSGAPKIFYREWIVENSSYTVFFIHGLTGHSGKYIEFGEYLAKNNVNVFMIDLRGHGLSEGRRGDVDSFDTYLMDVKDMVDFIERGYGLNRFFLSGHSMGGLIAVDYILKYNDERISGLILSSPGLKIGVKINPILKSLIYKIPKAFLIGYVNSRVYPELQTRDETKREEFREDRLIFRRISLRLASELFKTSEKVFEKADMVRKPLLVFIGTNDKLVDPVGVKDFFSRVPVEDKELIEIDGGLHEVFNELNREEIYKKVVEWIMKH